MYTIRFLILTSLLTTFSSPYPKMPFFSKAVVALGLASVAMAGHAEHLVSSGMAAYREGNNTMSVNSYEDDKNY